MLALRQGTVLAAGDPAVPVQEVDVLLGGERRAALNDVRLVGPVRVGDAVVVNVGTPSVVHVNLTRGLRAEGEPEGHTVKLAGTSLQHAVQPVEALAPVRPSGGP